MAINFLYIAELAQGATMTLHSSPIRTAVSLVELLVVIAILAILIGLLLPAVQAARESSRKTQCQSQLKQLALANLNHEQTHGFLPTGGWGGAWVGDPDRGFGPSQPGGWAFNILPYMEQQAVYSLGAGRQGVVKLDLVARRLTIPVPGFNCPSRRANDAFPLVQPGTTIPHGSAVVARATRTDYAANAGDQRHCEQPNFPGPESLAEGDQPGFHWPNTQEYTGIGFLRSQVRLADLEDGMSNVYLSGEKYLSDHNYETGLDHGDDWSLHAGFQDDAYRSTNSAWAPSPDTHASKGYEEEGRFGSAHSSGWFATMGDGSVHLIDFSIDPEVHRTLGNRADGGVFAP